MFTRSTFAQASIQNIDSTVETNPHLAEFFGSLALIAGFLTRLAAFGIGIVMLVAAVKVHLPYGFFTTWFGNQKGEGYKYFILAIGMAVTLVIVGGDAWPLDQALASVFPIGS
jgi:putative oxidoreductase